jgi:hypothetical protein
MRETIVSALMGLLDRGPDLPDAAAIESLAANLVLAVDHPQIDESVPGALAAALEQRGDQLAAGVLAGLAAFGRPPVAVPAREALERSPHASTTGSIGILRVERAALIEGPGAELLAAVLERPGRNKVHALVLGIDRGEGDGALAEVMLTPPLAPKDARAVFNIRSGEGRSRRIDLTAEELAERAVEAAARAVEAGDVLSHAAGTAIPIISRALTGDPGAMARPGTLSPLGDDDPALVVDATDEKRFTALMTALIDEFTAYLVRAGYDERERANAITFAAVMLKWKGGYADGRIGHWTTDDLAELLRDFVPKALTRQPEALAAAPGAAFAFLRFLDARGSLSGDGIERLEQARDALRRGQTRPR